MNISLSYPEEKPLNGVLDITGSKSQSNRLLTLLKLFDLDLRLNNLSTSDDTNVLIKALETSRGIVDVQHAGTSMRFLTSYFALKAKDALILTGSKRMQQRPISILVDALNSMGANISYKNKKGFPPLEIRPVDQWDSKVSLQANTSSQYISSLMLIGGYLKNGLEIQLIGKVTSRPYILLTQYTLESIGIKSTFVNNKIKIWPFNKSQVEYLNIESDWSSASYHYSLMALSKHSESELKLSSFYQKSIQGDSHVARIYTQLGVHTLFNDGQIVLTKRKEKKGFNHTMELNLSDTPDLAQTIAVTCFGLKIGCHLKGLHTLKIKETDRLEALKTELSKLGAQIEVNENSLKLSPRTIPIHRHVAIDTYDDHRMAMAFATLGILVPIRINDVKVVSKSYPQYWTDIQKLQFEMA
ncbi:MAG: 3-phosphoshikimate 1-carboxyvinyltransferase [Flavobacteriaceae bacterium]|nr:3-phosphoshikimate 1-carboxyvinyltransferase [Flavobacteriaceae bacterium]MCY4215569.1 3-phosphoshikimate 1-carboxyvinyltransferase [Flavobacteriaceae bacterium]MCY4253349.1 3-phosphoshikimate 1-carboxyvinyltransferase [Flavobacteriaceae bacterium]